MKITKKQALSDFQYLDENVDYLVDEDWLINGIYYPLMNGKDVKIIDIIVGSITDLVSSVMGEGSDEEIEFLETDKRALRIIERYKNYNLK